MKSGTFWEQKRKFRKRERKAFLKPEKGTGKEHFPFPGQGKGKERFPEIFGK